MGLRDRVRKTFGKKDGSSSSGGSTPSTSSDPSHYTGRTDIEYYKPHEIPKSKYKGKVDPEHKEMLDSYSFGDAFQTMRRRSSQALSGIMSPGGTKSQSRRPSCMSYTSKGAQTPGAHDHANPLSRIGTSHGNPPAALIRENSDDDTDVNNGKPFSSLPSAVLMYLPAGVSKPTTQHIPDVRLERQATVQEQPFTAAELEAAMSRVTLRADLGNSFHRNSVAIAAH